MKNKMRILLTLSFAVLAASFALQPASAQTTSTLSVFPAIQDKKVKAGEITRFQIQFRNGGDVAVSGMVKVADFIITDKEGTPQMVEDVVNKPKFAASEWMTPSADRITIPARDYVSVDVAVNVPDEVSTCGKYAMVYFERTPGADQTITRDGRPHSAAEITSKLGGLITFEMEGQKCTEMMSIRNLNIPVFQEYGPVKVSFDLFNGSDIHLIPQGIVMMVDSFGKPVSQASLEDKRIFPETAKIYEKEMGTRWMAGRYKVMVNASYGTEGKTIAQTAYIWVFPWKVAAASLLTVAIIIILLQNAFKGVVTKERKLEAELEEEKEEIEKLKKELHRKND